MSLKESDWKAVLDQPKNAGLKAGGGTGMSKVLRDHAAAETTWAQQKSIGTAAALERSLKAVGTQCDAVITKHGKVFTTACDYLKTVKQAAAARLKEVATEAAEVREQQYQRQRLEHLKETAKELCEDAKTRIRNAHNAGQVAAALEHAIPRLEHIATDLPNLRTPINGLKNFKPAMGSPSAKQYGDLLDAIVRAR